MTILRLYRHFHLTLKSGILTAIKIITYQTVSPAFYKKFDYTELPMVDELIADLYVLDDTTRRDLFEYTEVLKESYFS